MNMKAREGFTIVEVLVAATLFAIAALGLALLMLYVIRYGALNKARQEAIFKANTVLNYLMSLNYTDPCIQSAVNTTLSCASYPACCGSVGSDANVTWGAVPGADPQTLVLTVNANYTVPWIRRPLSVNITAIKGNF